MEYWGKNDWTTAAELPDEVFAVWRKADLAISPVAIIASVDPDGTPRTAPLGSLRAMSPKVLRFSCMHIHRTYRNLKEGGRVCVTLISPPGMAVSIRGQARLVKEEMKGDKQFAVFDVDIEEVKNDMAHRLVIKSGIEIEPRKEFKDWYAQMMKELESYK